MPNTHKSIEDTAGELWRCIKEDFEKEGVTLPDNWKGIGMAYGGYARACEILDQFAQQQVQEAVDEYKQFVLNVLDGVDIADEQMENIGGGTKAIRLALLSRSTLKSNLPDKE